MLQITHFSNWLNDACMLRRHELVNLETRFVQTVLGESAEKAVSRATDLSSMLKRAFR